MGGGGGGGLHLISGQYFTGSIMSCFLMYASETFYSKPDDCMAEVVYLTRNDKNKIWDLNLWLIYRQDGDELMAC